MAENNQATKILLTAKDLADMGEEGEAKMSFPVLRVR
jgi:hypothetical protein